MEREVGVWQVLQHPLVAKLINCDDNKTIACKYLWLLFLFHNILYVMFGVWDE